jgi:DNA-binding XRE family transcriptional regulator
MATAKRRETEHGVRRRFQEHRPTLEKLVASGEYTEPVSQGEYLEFASAVRHLRSARKAAGLSLDAAARRTGIDKAALSRLENGVADNPTINTLNRYAAALGKVLLLRIADEPKRPRARSTANA